MPVETKESRVPFTTTLSASIHDRLITYCAETGRKIRHFTEAALIAALDRAQGRRGAGK